MIHPIPLWDFHPDEDWEEERAELAQWRDTYQQRAESGDAEVARLLAQLCQEAWEEDEAAAMGDVHAIEYVEMYRP